MKTETVQGIGMSMLLLALCVLVFGVGYRFFEDLKSGLIALGICIWVVTGVILSARR